jgi:hypothetical protein
MTYQGQPEAAIGFLVELWDPWMRVVEGDEWGDLLGALLQCAELSESANDHQLTLYLCTYIHLDLVRAHEEGFWDDYVEDRHQKDILNAQADYEHTVVSWRERAKGFNGEHNTVCSDYLEELIAALPEWVKPQEQNRLLEIEMATLADENRIAIEETVKRTKRIEAIQAELGKEPE